MLAILYEAPWLRMGVFASLVLAFQETLFADVRWQGAGADLILLLAVAAGVAAGPVRGARVGFLLGIAFDLLVTTPFGLSALCYGLCAFLAGLIEPHVFAAKRGITPAVVAFAGALGTLLYASLADVFGVRNALTVSVFRIVLVVAIVNLLLGVPFVRVARWALLSGGRLRF
jgi:rod shape-determining protein MreD